MNDDSTVGYVDAGSQTWCVDDAPEGIENDKSATVLLAGDDWLMEVGPCCKCGRLIADIARER